jgi:hypothetical protein
MSTLDELEKLEKAATPGPWRKEYSQVAEFHEEQYIVAPPGEYETENKLADTVVIGTGYHDSINPLLREEDAALIAAARNALSGLIVSARERDALRLAVNKVACDCEFLVRSEGGAQTHHVELIGQLLRAALAGKVFP